MEQLEQQLSEAKAEVVACIEFLHTQMGWEYWWSDGWINLDADTKSIARQNANALRDFLSEKAHGIEMLKSIQQKEDQLATVTAERDNLKAALRRTVNALNAIADLASGKGELGDMVAKRLSETAAEANLWFEPKP